MIQAILWKETRDQGLIALTLLVVGGALLAAAAAFADPPTTGARPADVLQYLGVGRLATLMLAVTAGIVTGGALFAAEREAGTLTFLESLPGSRRQLWQAKIVAGAGLTILQIAGVLLISAALGLVTEPSWMQSIAAESLLAFAWGAFGSTYSRTTLGSVGIAIPFASACTVLFMLPILILFGSSGGLPQGIGTPIFFSLMLATPLIASALAYSHVDHQRQAATPEPSSPRVATSANPRGLTRPRRRWSATPVLALTWMVSRQLVIPTLVLSAFALVFGCTLLVPGIMPLIYWAMMALSAGVICGVLTFGAEQSRGEYRFWAESRLPLRRLWLVKLTLHLLLLAWLLLLLALPSVMRAAFLAPDSPARARTFLGTVFHAKILDELQGKTWLFLLLPAVYGFASGHLGSLLFRKPVVAAGVAGLLGGVLALFWIPSLLAGGVSNWQVWSPAAALVILTGVMIRAWTLDRLLHRRSLSTLGLGCGVAILCLIVGLATRVYQVPRSPNLDEDLEFVAQLAPILERNSGREFQTAVAAFMRAHEGVTGMHNLRFLRDRATDVEIAQRPKLAGWHGFDAFDGILLNGWTTGVKDDQGKISPRFDANDWLNRLFAEPAIPREGDWRRDAARATASSPGVYWDPRLLSLRTGMAALDEARWMGSVLLLRGLQQQDLGDTSRFPENLAIVLALTRSMRSGSVIPSFLTSIRLERMAALATHRWLEGRKATPESLRRVRDLWLAADREATEDPRRCLLAERYVVRESMAAPSAWLEERLPFSGESTESIDSTVNLLSTAWSVPWERERTHRLLGLTYENSQSAEMAYLRGRPGGNLFYQRRTTPESLVERDLRRQAARRLLILALSLAAYERAHGQPAASLDELRSSGELRELPFDPYANGQGFRYRVSQGDTLVLYSTSNRSGSRNSRPWSGSEITPAIEVPTGQGIVWSVGPAGINAEGRRVLSPSDPVRLEDDELLILVPRER